MFSNTKNKFLISCAIESERLIDFTNGSDIKYGHAHYSWKISAYLYKRGLDYSKIKTRYIVRPEIYRTEMARKVSGIDENDVHLCVKPIEHIRKLPGVKNICISGWEFPEFSDFEYQNNPFNNHVSVLSKATEIWCWSSFTTKNLNALGLKNARTMAPPVLVRKFSDVDHSCLSTVNGITYGGQISLGRILFNDYLAINKGKTIFLAVINPGDRRKQTKTMIEAFVEALRYNNDLVLVVKLIIDNVTITLDNVTEYLNGFHGLSESSKNIFFIGDVLNNDQMVALMNLSKFYLCTSSTEGLNLPIIEAMGQGVVPISSNATAMQDYIDNENALVLDSDQRKTVGSYHMLHEHLETTHYPPRLYSVINQILEAGKMSNDAYKNMSENASKKVKELYSLDSFKVRINDYLV